MVVNPGSNGRATKSLPVVKVGAGGRIEVTAVMEHALGLSVHWKDRSYVCVGKGCPACEVSGSRLVFFLGVAVDHPQQGRRLSILEMSAGSWGRLCGLAKLEGLDSVLGVRLDCTRYRKNSPLVVVPASSHPDVIKRPLEKNLFFDALTVLLRLPCRWEGEEVLDWFERLKPSFARQLEQAFE